MKGACVGVLTIAGVAVILVAALIASLAGMWGRVALLCLLAGGLVTVSVSMWLYGLLDSDEYLHSIDYPARRPASVDNLTCLPQPQAFVYFIENQAGHVKIGWSKDPVKRLKTLQTGSSDPLALVYAAGFVDEAEARHCEGVLHCRLAARRVYGEWFMAEGLDYERLIDDVSVAA